MPDAYKTLPIVWLSMLIAVFIIAGITFSGVIPVEAEAGSMIPFVLAVPALGNAGMSLAGVRLLMRKTPAQSAYILRFAFAESVGIFGLVAHLQGGPLPLTVGFFVVSLVCMVASRPTPDGYTSWEMGQER